MMQYQRGRRCELLRKVTGAGERPVCHLHSRAYGMHPQGDVRQVWSAKWVVNFIQSSTYVWDQERTELWCKRLWKESFKCLRLLEGRSVGPVLLGEIGAWRWHSCSCLRCCLSCRSEAVHLWINFLRRSHSLSVCVCVHASGDLHSGLRSSGQVIEVTVRCSCLILGVRCWLHGLVRPVSKHGHRSLTCLQASKL